jgi:hypothetical protein
MPFKEELDLYAVVAAHPFKNRIPKTITKKWLGHLRGIGSSFYHKLDKMSTEIRKNFLNGEFLYNWL